MPVSARCSTSSAVRAAKGASTPAMPARAFWEGTRRRCATISTNAPPGSPWPRCGWTARFRAARRSVRISIRAISTATASGRCGSRVSNASATGSGCAAACVPAAGFSASAGAAECICATMTASCSAAITTGCECPLWRRPIHLRPFRSGRAAPRRFCRTACRRRETKSYFFANLFCLFGF